MTANPELKQEPQIDSSRTQSPELEVLPKTPQLPEEMRQFITPVNYDQPKSVYDDKGQPILVPAPAFFQNLDELKKAKGAAPSEGRRWLAGFFERILKAAKLAKKLGVKFLFPTSGWV